MKKLSRNNKLLILLIAVLMVMVAVTAYLNTGDRALKRQLEADQQFIISWDGQQVFVTMDDILSLQPKDYPAVLDTSISDAKEVTVRGVELSALLDYVGAPWKSAEYFEINGLDEYYSPVLLSEVQEPDNVLICIAMDGKALGNKSSGGFGPYLMVIRNELFSQRWCKYIEEVALR